MSILRNVRRLLFGDPFPTARAEHTRLSNILALPVFASDALSSVSYATEEILLVLVLAGASAAVLSQALPIGIAIALLLGIVAFSYRQTIFAYPQGGGAYRVAGENLGMVPGLTAAAALLIDYVLTVAVSISAGVAAITSAFPAAQPYAVWMACGFVILVGLANLRGAKESGVLFAIPTYLFLASLFVMLGVGFTKLVLGHEMTPPQPDPDTWSQNTAPLGIFLILRAFASGCTALTGIEAVSDGVPAFSQPAARNAATVLAWLGVILITLFLGITFLANQLHVVPFPAHMEHDAHRETVVSQVAAAVFGRTPLYLLVQVSTAMILILAANTAYVDFPRLSQFLARDSFLPRQLANLGDRLVYSNGILVLTLLSIITIVAFNASTHQLIPLYALGVFLSFTLSQTGMVARWLKLKPEGWQVGAIINTIGASATFVVLLVIAVTKFVAGDPVHFFPLTTPAGYMLAITFAVWILLASLGNKIAEGWVLAGLGLTLGYVIAVGGENAIRPLPLRLGCWMVMVAIPAVVWICYRIRGHYAEVAELLSMERYRPIRPFRNTILLLVPNVHRGVMPALQYARTLGGDVRGVYVEVDPTRTATVMERWQRYVQDVPLVVLESPYRGIVGPILDYIDQVEKERTDDIVTVILPEFVTQEWWSKILHNQSGLMLKWAMLFKRGVVLTNIRYYLDEDDDDHAREHHPLTARL